MNNCTLRFLWLVILFGAGVPGQSQPSSGSSSPGPGGEAPAETPEESDPPGTAPKRDPQAASLPSVDLSKEKVLYVVGYAHLDTQWRWDYATTIEHYIPATLRQNFALFEKHPDYVFNFTGSSRFELMEEYYPEDFQRLKKYIDKGVFRVVGSSVDEGDVNVPSSEALMRQVLYGNKYFRSKFSRAGVDFMLPDCFGFPASLPSVLSHCGLKGFVTQKLTWGLAVPLPFNVGVWEGPDGESIVSAMNPGAYVHKLRHDLSTDERWIERIEALGEEAGVFADYHFYGVGDRGGAPDEGSVEWLEKSIAGEGPIRVIPAASDQLFRDLTEAQIARLPRYRGDLLLTEHSAGSLTSQAYMKRWNRKNELLADSAERASVMASHLGSAEYPRERLEKAWVRVLVSQMHDILPGTSIPKAYEYSWNDEVLALNQFAAVLEDAVGAVTRSLDTQGKGISLVVYNPLSIDRGDLVEATIEFRWGMPRAVRVFDADGKEVPSQIVARNDDSLEIVFAADVPAVGWAVYDVRPAEGPCEIKSALSVGRTFLENDRYRVELNDSGDVARVLDKNLGKDLLSGPSTLVLLKDAPANWPAWNMDWKDLQADPVAVVGGPAKMRVVEDGPARVSVEIEREVLGSRFLQQVRLAAGRGGDRVEFDTLIEWHSQGVCLKAVFPLSASDEEATYNLGLGTIRRATNDEKKYEVPSHQWFDLTDEEGSFGAAVLEDCKFGSDKPDEGTLRLTLLRTPIANSYVDQGTQDLGTHEVLYALAGHVGDWRRGEIPWRAARLNQPLLPFQAPKHAGALGKRVSLLQLNTNKVAVRALKREENGNQIVVRLQELEGRPVAGVRVSFFEPVVAARELDGQERVLGSAKVEDGKLVSDFGGYGVRTFAVELASKSTIVRTPVSAPLLDLDYDVDARSRDREENGGDFDGEGRAFPEEMLPEELVCDDVRFVLAGKAGSKENRSALSCRGQTLSLPEGSFERVYLLAASSHGDLEAEFRTGSQTVTRKIPHWRGMIGQWDRRLWRDDEMIGIVPGYIKRTPVAWWATHHHDEDGANQFYEFSYLFKVRLDLPKGCREVVLPNNGKIKIFAATAVSGPNDDARAATPLYDTLDFKRTVSPPFVSNDSGSFGSGFFVGKAEIELATPTEGTIIRYTLDGSDPTVESPRYGAPIVLAEPTLLKARGFRDGEPPSRLFEQRFEKVELMAPEPETEVAPGVSFEYFEIDELRALPDFEEFEPAESGSCEGLSIDGRRRDDDFSFRFRGFLKVDVEGVYVFSLTSDDGSKLLIGGKTIVDHDGLHGPSTRRGFAPLAVGLHRIEVHHFERGGGEELRVGVRGPGLRSNEIPPSMLFRKKED